MVCSEHRGLKWKQMVKLCCHKMCWNNICPRWLGHKVYPIVWGGTTLSPTSTKVCTIQSSRGWWKTHRAKNTDGIISAITVCAVSFILSLRFYCFLSPCWWGKKKRAQRLLGDSCRPLPPRRFLSALNVTGALGAQITLESYIFMCSFCSGAQTKNEGGGGEGEMSYPRQEKWPHLSSPDLGERCR